MKRLRPVSDGDAEALTALIGGVYREYPGCVLDLTGVDADLTAPATHAAATGSEQWVCEDGDGIVACVGMGTPDDAGLAELKRLYVAATHRRRGLAAALLDHVESAALAAGATGMTLWSDSRFLDAHRFYGRHGYRPTGEERHLGDPSDTTEYRFVRSLRETPAGTRGADGRRASELAASS